MAVTVRTSNVKPTLARRRQVWSMGLLMTVLLAAPAAGQSDVDPGFNLFSREQEIELGRQAASEVEQELPVLEDETVQDYVRNVGGRLAAHAPGAEYPYTFTVLNLAEANAFALPGGFMYVNRGLLELVDTESQLAGVLAHEIAHVALRHGTNQASKSYLAQGGLAILGALLGDSTAGNIAGAVSGVGVPLLFLKFSRSAEEQADTVGTQIMHGAGYDPAALAAFFDTLEQKNDGGPPEFLSSHPSYENRRENIQHEAAAVGGGGRSEVVGGLGGIQSRLGRLPDAPKMADVMPQ